MGQRIPRPITFLVFVLFYLLFSSPMDCRSFSTCKAKIRTFLESSIIYEAKKDLGITEFDTSSSSSQKRHRSASACSTTSRATTATISPASPLPARNSTWQRPTVRPASMTPSATATPSPSPRKMPQFLGFPQKLSLLLHTNSANTFKDFYLVTPHRAGSLWASREGVTSERLRGSFGAGGNSDVPCAECQSLLLKCYPKYLPYLV